MTRISLCAQKIDLFSRANCEHNRVRSPCDYYQELIESSFDLQLLHLNSDSENSK
jgi:hypothetical protein